MKGKYQNYGNPRLWKQANKDPTQSYVYVIRVEGTDFFKVGYAKNSVEQRVKHLQTANPLNLIVVALIECEDGRRVEKMLHKTLTWANWHGEWFKCKPIIIKKTLEDLKDYLDYRFFEIDDEEMDIAVSWTSDYLRLLGLSDATPQS